jgi:hypothetical protein
MYIADKSICQGSFCVHVVLKLPIIKKDGLNIMFDVQQTGIRHGEMCARYNLPENVYRSQGKFYSLGSPMCNTISNLRICTNSINGSRAEMPCVTNQEGCVPVAEPCETKIIQSSAGVLVRTNEDIRASTVGDPDTYDREKTGSNGVAWFNYSQIQDILVGRFKIKGLRTTTLERVIELENPKEWLDNILSDTKVLARQNLTKLWDIVDEQKRDLGMFDKEGIKFAGDSWWVTPVIGAIVIIILGYYAVHRYGPKCRGFYSKTEEAKGGPIEECDKVTRETSGGCFRCLKARREQNEGDPCDEVIYEKLNRKRKFSEGGSSGDDELNKGQNTMTSVGSEVRSQGIILRDVTSESEDEGSLNVRGQIHSQDKGSEKTLEVKGRDYERKVYELTHVGGTPKKVEFAKDES